MPPKKRGASAAAAKGSTRPKRAKKEVEVKAEPEEEEEEKPKGKGKKAAAAKGSTRPKRTKKEVEVKDKPEEEEEEKPKRKGKKGAAKSKGKSGGAAEPETKEVRRVMKRASAPVDRECFSMRNKSHVFTEGKDVYDALLHQTNLSNNIEYYLLQLLEEDSAKRYSVWFRWGRDGTTGQNSLFSCGTDLDHAKDIFTKKFQEKTNNEWAERKKFREVAGKYDFVEYEVDTEWHAELDQIVLEMAFQPYHEYAPLASVQAQTRLHGVPANSADDHTVSMATPAETQTLGVMTSPEAVQQDVGTQTT